jgi:hypothetical protein
MKKLMHYRILLGTLLAAGLQVALADVHIPVGGSISLNGGRMDNIGNLSIEGTLDGGSGGVSLAGNWTRTGTFVPGASTVSFFDGGRGQSTFAGDTRFHALSLVSSTGKTYVIDPANTLEIDATLTIRGLSGAPIQVSNSDPSRVAFVNLAADGTQDIEFVGVSNVHANIQPLAPTQTNQGGTGNDRGWFGSPLFDAIPVPGLSPLALLLLALLMFATTTRRALR